ncbi:MAG: AAA family ATPase [Spirochaetales bacterium]
MFLKGLEVFGFKSFADRTRIEFADGITALLGPNGCGKSNVVDAVKWVLGEQASKTLRAEKMEDVIFNGTESRKPLNLAEVTLILANDTGLLPLDTSEITIKRRLYRSGEGEYWINNRQCKLKDVRELFWDTGVGKTAYSVMEQGKIDQILSSKPEDRRYLFEEAAGITRFKVKRAEAERKLERTEENMRQVEVILGEVKRSYDSLKVQAEKTATYRRVKDEVFEYELDIQLLRLKNFVQDKHNREENIQKATEKRDAVQSNIDAIHTALSEHVDEVNAMEGELVTMQQKIYGLAIEERSKTEQLRHFEENCNVAKEKIRHIESKKTALQERIELLTEDTDEQEGSLQDLHRRLGEIAKNIASFEENISFSGDKIIENDKNIASLEDAIAELDKVLAVQQKQLESITENIVTELDVKLKEAGYSAQAVKANKEELSHIVGKLKIVASGRKKIFSDFATVDSPSKNDVVKFSRSAVDSFGEIEMLLENLEHAIQSFSKVTPSFIEDFLSPEGIITQKRSIDDSIQENRSLAQEKREKITEYKTKNTDLSLKMEEYRVTLQNLRINQAQMKTQIQAADDQLRILRRELASQEGALRDLENELFTEMKRFEDIESQMLDAEGEIAVIQREGVRLTTELENLEKTITSRNSDVDGKREKLKNLTAEMATHQQNIEKQHIDLGKNDTEIKNLKENFKETHSRDLMEFEERMFTINAPASELREKLVAVKQQIRELGNINLMAVEEFAEAKDRYDFLTGQITDLQKARDDLNRITDEIRAESTELFLATYNKIKKNFHNMFRRLFGGGRAELRLSDPQNVLASGIDIFAQPPGKKLENIALLSGGEKTMTAVSLLFATYMVRPSPFCLLDEIDAALDEQNVLRFVQTLREFSNLSQYIVITHNKKTVAGANTLLGVTMEEFGISKIITIRLENDGEGNIRLPEPEPFDEEEVELEQDVYIPPHPPKRIKKTATESDSQKSVINDIHNDSEPDNAGMQGNDICDA